MTLTASGFILYLDFYRETLAQANVVVVVRGGRLREPGRRVTSGEVSRT